MENDQNLYNEFALNSASFIATDLEEFGNQLINQNLTDFERAEATVIRLTEQIEHNQTLVQAYLNRAVTEIGRDSQTAQLLTRTAEQQSQVVDWLKNLSTEEIQRAASLESRLVDGRALEFLGKAGGTFLDTAQIVAKLAQGDNTGVIDNAVGLLAGMLAAATVAAVLPATLPAAAIAAAVAAATLIGSDLGSTFSEKIGFGATLIDFVSQNLINPMDGLNNLSQAINDLFTSARNWFQRRDPLTLDLDSDGLETVGIDPANPILFDHDGDGVANATGWIKPDDGFLVLDRNGNGLIDNGTELFGDSTPLYAGGTAADGFAALAQEDTNGDGLVNAGDANWDNLRVWQDANSDGITDAGELHSLESLGITGFHVAKSENTTRLSNGNQIADLGSFIRNDGTEGTVGQITGGMADIDLADNPFYRSFSDTVPLTEQAQALPDMQGSGLVRDLREAVSLSPALGSALTDYAAADTKAAQMALVDSVISQWAASSGFQTSIEKAAAQNDQLLFLVPGLKTYDVLGGGFASSGGSSTGSTALSLPTPEQTAKLDALKAQQIHITQILGLLEKFNGMTFINVEEQGVRIRANRFAEDGGQYPKQAANDAVLEMRRVG